MLRADTRIFIGYRRFLSKGPEASTIKALSVRYGKKTIGEKEESNAFRLLKGTAFRPSVSPQNDYGFSR